MFFAVAYTLHFYSGIYYTRFTSAV